MKSEIKEGDKVRMTDHSYHVDLINGELKHMSEMDGYYNNANRTLYVVKTGLCLPAWSYAYNAPLTQYSDMGRRTDTILWCPEEKCFVFTCEVYLQKITDSVGRPSECPYCGGRRVL